MPQLPAGPYPGDNIIPEAVMAYDQAQLVKAPPADVWPWIMQVGKGRGGWYTPASWDRYMPKSWQATRTINPAWQELKPGDRVDDYGFSSEDYFIVSEVHPQRALVYKSDRYGASFSWSLILHDLSKEESPSTLVHLRFRGKIAATGLKRRLLVWGGGVLDHLTTAPMLAGLAERAEQARAIHGSSPSPVLSPVVGRHAGVLGPEAISDCCHEISAKEGEGIDEVFPVIARKLVDKYTNEADQDKSLETLQLRGKTPRLDSAGHAQGYFDLPRTRSSSFRIGYDNRRQSWLSTQGMLGGPGTGDDEHRNVDSSGSSKSGRCCQ